MDALVRVGGSSPPLSPTTARLALAEAADVASVASIVDRLSVVRLAAKKAKLSLDAQNDWAVVKLEAERKAGSMLSELRRAGQLREGRPNADDPSALSSLGVTQQQSSRWQRLAAVPEQTFQEWLAKVRESQAEVTEVGLAGLAARLPRPDKVYVRPTDLPEGTAPRNIVIEGDCLQVLPTLPDSSVDAMVTDPPAAISFMGERWDDDRGGRDAWVTWMTDVFRHGLRVLKPGAYALVWSLPRTSHWTALALEEAGFEIRDAVIHVFLQGMPKTVDLGPAVAGLDATASAEWEGFAQGLKPAHETWWLARKPTDLSAAENLLTWGTGALNIDAGRIELARDDSGREPGPIQTNDAPPGRWPANVVLTDPVFDGGVDEVVGGGSSKGGSYPAQRGPGVATGFSTGRPTPGGARQVGDEGGKSRFFLIPKAGREDRGYANDHPTVKPVALMRQFVRLIAPPGGLVIDPFAGSGTSGVACQLEGMDYLLIEQEPDYVAIARRRLGLADDHTA